MSDAIEVTEKKIPATDGFELAATITRPAAIEGAPAVLITSAMGVKRSYYEKYARFLAENGFAAVTFDYRGIGGSRPPRLRGFDASMQDWAEKDIAGVIDWIHAELKPRRFLVVGHSAGGQLVGLTPNNDRIHAMITVGAQSGYWGLWAGSRKVFMWCLWHAIMPGATRAFSYFPSKKLGLPSEDLPAGVARQWAHWGRNPNYIVDEDGKPIRDKFVSFTAPIRSYSFADDRDAPRAAVESLVGCYTQAPKEMTHKSPSDLGVDAIGHFGFFRERFRGSLWSEAAAWMKTHAS